ncbi:vesicle formation protein [Sphaerotilus mobilis]|uniref:OmpA-like domain-containing protein n=1 Tax=Sphaerotilus mobilis TaxID=47994 RepID=A0A4V2EXA3_9BURK|nr:vesicle formation protein [Sphaerotilus mobilis]RZS58790.1 hypothetical protein EV685_1090 [Sphaerotilus mobilis]
MSAASHSIDAEEDHNFWPGYVDTLVNMVMFLILLIVILAMAVIFFSARARFDAMQTQQGPVTDQPIDPTPAPMLYPNEKQPLPGEADRRPNQPTLEDMTKMVDELKKKLFLAEQRYKPVLNPPQAKEEREVKDAKGEQTVEATQPKPVADPKGVQEFSLRPTALIVNFKPGALDLNAEEADRLAQLFARHFDTQANPGQRYLISAEAAEGLSESSRMAYYRVTAVRNRLMGVAGVPRDALQQRVFIVPTSEVKGTEALSVRITVIAPVAATPAASN